MTTITDVKNDWELLGSVPSDSLTDARLQVHHATQIISVAGRTLLESQEDDSHTNMEWNTGSGMLTGMPVGAETKYRAGLDFETLTLKFLDARLTALDQFPLEGNTLSDGYDWLKSRIETSEGLPESVKLKLPEYDLPDHPVAQGDKFTFDQKRLRELRTWYTNANTILSLINSHHPNSSPIRCWPHHFDIATLLTVQKEPEKKTIGVGMTPGDNSYSEPYWYLSPWPYPKAPSPKQLESNGEWHTNGWFGAVLPASSMQPTDSAADQAEMVRLFIHSAMGQLHSFLKS